MLNNEFDGCQTSSSSSDSQDGLGLHRQILDPWHYMINNGLYFMGSDDDEVDEDELYILKNGRKNEEARIGSRGKG